MTVVSRVRRDADGNARTESVPRHQYPSTYPGIKFYSMRIIVYAWTIACTVLVRLSSHEIAVDAT